MAEILAFTRIIWLQHWPLWMDFNEIYFGMAQVEGEHCGTGVDLELRPHKVTILRMEFRHWKTQITPSYISSSGKKVCELRSSAVVCIFVASQCNTSYLACMLSSRSNVLVDIGISSLVNTKKRGSRVTLFSMALC